jgi:hypothetical protein
MTSTKNLLILAILSWTFSCSGEKGTPSIKLTGHLVFEDHFDRRQLGPNWLDTGGGYRIENGMLRAQGARNHPLWLKKTKLPTNTKVLFTAFSTSPDVDIKVELFGDGKSKANAVSYNATSYVFILGGWRNSMTIIAKMDEHGNDRKVRKKPRGIVNKKYRFSIVRSGHHLAWSIDEKEFLEMNDPKPLMGSGHEYFAINNWSSEVFFDDLAIYAL